MKDTHTTTGRKSLKGDSGAVQGEIKKAADNQQPKTRTSLYIPPDMLKGLKYKAIENETSVNEIILDLIKAYLTVE